MKISYQRGIRHNYLMIVPEELIWEGYESRMLAGNRIEGLLYFQVRQEEEGTRLLYEITSRQPLSRLLEGRSIRAAEIRLLVSGIMKVLERMEGYLLRENHILLEPDYLYVDPESFQVWLCLVPGLERNFPEDFGKFLEYLLECVDHEDQESVVLAYGLYQETRKENYGMSDIYRILCRNQEAALAGTARDRSSASIQKEEETGKALPEGDRVRGQSGLWNREEDKVRGQSGPWNREEDRGRGQSGPWNREEDRGSRSSGLWNREKEGVVDGSSGLWNRGDSGLSYSGQAYSGSGGTLGSSRQQKDRTRDKSSGMGLIGGISLWFRSHFSRSREEIPVEVPWEMMFGEDPGAKAEKMEWQLQEHVPATEGRGQEASNAQPMGTALLADLSDQTGTRRLRALDPENENITIGYYPFIIGKQQNLVDYQLNRDTVSRLHVRIDQEGDTYQIQDLNSTNGTYVKGKLLENNQVTELCLGDEIRIANFRYLFE